MSEKSLEQELFDMVYQWGRKGVVTDYMGNAYQSVLNDIKAEEANLARVLIWGIGYDSDATALMLRDKLWERIQYLKNLNRVTDLAAPTPLGNLGTANPPNESLTDSTNDKEN